MITTGFGGIKLTRGDIGLDGFEIGFSGLSFISHHNLQKPSNHTQSQKELRAVEAEHKRRAVLDVSLKPNTGL
ncbi:MAG: hypothetical protein LBF65_01350 [Holosporales bacterium]|nr:hypothetical protein [Holosporales bacterium]